MTQPTIHILLVEDNPGDVLLVRKALEEVHPEHELTLTEDGLEALQYLLRQPPYQAATRPDLVLLDLNLPRMSGQELIDLLAPMSAMKSIPLVVLTSSPHDQQALEKWRPGKSLYLIKPTSYSELRDMIAQVVDFLAWAT